MTKVFIDLDILRKLEWQKDEYTGLTGGRCPICGGYKTGKMGTFSILHAGEFEGHAQSCALKDAIERGALEEWAGNAYHELMKLNELEKE